MSKALLICNGDKPGKWLKKVACKADFILAADGGADAALAAGVIPDAVIGDLDSVSPRTRKQLQDTPFIHIKRQDNTDLEKSLDWLVRQGFTSCLIVGATGGRLDFTLGNILSVRPYARKLDISFCDHKWSLHLLTRSFQFSAPKGTRVSLLPLTPCKNVTLKGLKYPLSHENISPAHTGKTLSNETIDSVFDISFTSGQMLVYIEDCFYLYK